MIKVPGPGNGRLVGFTAAAELSVSGLFTILWDALADLLGTAATATLLKRAARRAQARSPELAELAIQRQGLTYSYTCPPGWSGMSGGTPPVLRELIGELRPLLIEMTGQLVIQSLERILELRELVLLAPQEEQK
jgi:hypothetical protein